MSNAREKQTAPFKVGDRVERIFTSNGHDCPVGNKGTIGWVEHGPFVTVQWDNQSIFTHSYKSNLRKLEDPNAPCLFKVGDKVERIGTSYFIAVGTKGWIDAVHSDRVSVEWENGEYTSYYFTNPDNRGGMGSLRKVEDAPVKVVYDSPDYARSLEQEIVRLTAEAATLRAERNKWTEEAANYAQNSDHHKAKREEAESALKIEHPELLEARKQLEDIAAIERVNRLVSALHGTDLKQDWTFHGLIIAVTEGKVAA